MNNKPDERLNGGTLTLLTVLLHCLAFSNGNAAAACPLHAPLQFHVRVPAAKENAMPRGVTRWSSKLCSRAASTASQQVCDVWSLSCSKQQITIGVCLIATMNIWTNFRRWLLQRNNKKTGSCTQVKQKGVAIPPKVSVREAACSNAKKFVEGMCQDSRQVSDVLKFALKADT